MGHQGRPAAARLPEGGNGRPGIPGKAPRRRPITASGAHAAPGGGRARGAPQPVALSNWPVGWRLFAVIVLSLLIGLTFGSLQVASAVNQAHRFAQVTKLARLGQQAIVLVQALEDERAATAMDLAKHNGNADQDPYLSQDLQAWYGPLNGSNGNDATKGTTGLAASRFLALAAGIDASYPAVTQTAVTTVEQQVIDTLAGMRSTAQSTGSIAPDGGQLNAVADYSLAIANLFQLNDLIAQNSGDTVLTTDVQSLGVLSRAKDQVSQQHAILWAALTSYSVYPGMYDGNDHKPSAAAIRAMTPTYQALANSSTQAAAYLVSFQASATTTQQQELQSIAFLQPNAEMHTIETYATGQQDLDLRDGLNLPNAAGQWNAIATTAISQLRTVETHLAQSIVDRSVSDQQTAERTAWLTSGLTGATLLLVLILALIVARSVVLPLRRLRAGALDIASVTLPERVRELSEKADPAESLEVAPINVMSSDEVGQVARAFDLVHQEAVRLAGNEAVLRASLNAMFVSLSRRSQSGIDRLSRMISAVTSHHPDDALRADLAAMDRLLGRMRRNCENLLVLAGYESVRKWGAPVPLAEAARSAASGIDPDRRLLVSVPPDLAVAGHAATDFTHLLAELVENAANFSPKEAPITLNARELAGGIQVEVADSGLGMMPDRLDEMNARLADPPVADALVSRRMGLFAVAHLAARHGALVRLRPATDGPGVNGPAANGSVMTGTVAQVWLPAAITVGGAEGQAGTADTGIVGRKPARSGGYLQAAAFRQTAGQPAVPRAGATVRPDWRAVTDPRPSSTGPIPSAPSGRTVAGLPFRVSRARRGGRHAASSHADAPLPHSSPE